jgi:predicted DCC family thiol-disulfide oxidoreductase YuxK
MTFYMLLDGSTHHVPLAIALAHSHFFSVLSAVLALAFELTFVLCVLFPRATPAYLATGVALHTGIWVLLRAPFFQFLALYAAFAEPMREVLRRRAPSGSRPPSSRVWTVVYDGYCPLCIRTMTQLDALDGVRRLRPVDLEREWGRVEELVPGVSREKMREEMAVVTPEGKVLRGFLAAREVSRTLPALWVLLPVVYAPGAKWAGTRVYAWVARNRARRLREGICARYMG